MVSSRNYQIVLFLLFVIFFIRSPFFFTDVFNWDESTYIIIGQWIADGFAPYVNRTEVKPPLLGYLYAFVVYLSGNQLFFIRVFNLILVLISLYFIIKIFTKYTNRNNYYIIISSFIFASTYIIEDSLALLSEHFASTFLIIAFYYLIKRSNARHYFKIGFFLGCAALTRSNLAILPIFYFFYLYFLLLKNSPLKNKYLGFYILGGSIIFALTFLQSILNNNILHVLSSIIISGMSMAENAPNSLLGAIYYMFFWKSDIFDLVSLQGPFRLFFWGGSLCSFIIILIKNFRIFSDLLIFFILILISIIVGSRATAHYLILLLPFCSIFFSIFVLDFLYKKKFFHTIYAISLMLCILISFAEYKKIVKNYAAKKTLYNGPAFQVVDFIQATEDYKNQDIYIYKRHIVYWLLKKNPPTDISHPSDIFKEFLYKGWGKGNSNKKIEMNKILEKKPKYLILNKKKENFFLQFYSMDEYKNISTLRNYKLKKTIEYKNDKKKIRYLFIYEKS